MTKDKPKQQAQQVDNDKLRAEVKAFAAELGFGNHAAGSFEYDDFAPERAIKKIKPGAAEGKKQPAKQQPAKQQHEQSGKQQQPAKQPVGKSQKDRVDTQHQKQQHNERWKGGQQQQQQQQQQEGLLSKQEQNLDAVRSRQWVESVGPRPGEARGKSLLGKDEPTIWYEAAAGLGPLSAADPKAAKQLDESAVEALRQKAEGLLEREAQLFEKEMAGRNAADARWLGQVRRSGTTADKVAAMSLLVTSSGTANVTSIDGLLGMMAKSGGGRQVVVAAMEALQELFLTHLLPDRKLKVLEAQPLAALPPGKDGERRLLLWAVEDAVKRRYQQFVQLLEKASTDNLDFIKEKAIKVISRLLSAKPEGEQALLAALVNKLGDPSRKLASDAAYLLGQLLLEHPAMKPVVVREVERFVFRPGLAERGRYYAVTFLNQLALSHRPQDGGSELAQKLIDIYFSLFRLLLEGKLGNAAARQQQGAAAKAGKAAGSHRGGNKHHGNKKGAKGAAEEDGEDSGAAQQAAELDARMLSALITGVRRAFPYVDAEKVEPLVEVHSEALFRLVHTAPFTVSLQALMLMHQLLSGRNAVSDRFYRALYAVLLTEGSRGAAGVRAPQFLSLLVKAMRGDVSIKRVAAFAKRLLQVACHAPSNWAAGALLVLSEVLRAQPGLWAAVQQPEDAAGQAETFKDVAAAAAGDDGQDSDEEEVFRDVADSDAEEAAAAQHEDGDTAAAAGKAGKAGIRKGVAVANGVAAANGSARDAAAAAAAAKWPRDDYYDMRKREPLYASAEVSCWWELLLLCKHSHPSVAAFARSLLAGSPVEYGGDPLRDLNLPAFLDKFVNKKPKATPRGSSLMQPTHSLAATAAAAGVTDAAASVAPDVARLGGQAFSALAEADVGADQLFFHRFFNLQSVRAKQAASGKAKAARAAAAEQSGLGGMAGLASDEEEGDEELGELGDAVASDELDDVEVDRALAEAEGVGDDELGDPDIGFNYDQLLDAIAGDGDGDGTGSGDGDEDLREGEDDDAAEGEEEEEHDGSSGDQADEEGGEGEMSDDGDGGAGSSEVEDEDDEDSSSDGDDAEWVMMEGAEDALTAGGAAASGSKQKKRKLDTAAGDAADAELQDVNPHDIPSPSSSEDGGSAQQQQQQQGSRKKQKQEQKQQQQQKQQTQQQEGGSGSEDDDLDLDLDDIIGGSDDAAEDEEAAADMLNYNDAAAAAAGGSSSDEDAAAAAAQGAKQRKQKRGSAGLFASADGYASYFQEYEKALAAGEKADGAGATAAAAADAGSSRGKHRGRQDAGEKRLHAGSSKSSKRQNR